MSALRDVIYKYKDKFNNLNKAQAENAAKGRWFEKICKYFFKHDLYYKQRFEEVWLWNDWPGRNNMPDTGIDLVAKLKNLEAYCAIQCKFYEHGHKVSKPEIDSFLSASGKKDFAERIIVSFADDWNKNAEDAIQDQQVPCVRLSFNNLEQSAIDWSAFELDNLDKVKYKAQKILREDQLEAVDKVISGFKSHDRGKLIMACGTGKTFTSLKIAEKFAGRGGVVLFLVPSIALLNQSLMAYNSDHDINLNLILFAVCSDKTVGQSKDDEDLSIIDLACPATTNTSELLSAWNAIPKADKENSMTVVFSTYQSLNVITQAQQNNFNDFDLVICDEAHRTTGVTLKDEVDKGEESSFVKVHDDKYIKARKRLYMTATPRIFKASQARRAAEAGAVLCSMDDETKYGPEFYRLSFSKAVKLGLLSDYKVMILAVDEGFISDGIAAHDDNNEIKLSDAAKIIGCWKGLSKKLSAESMRDLNLLADPAPMRSAVAFSSSIKNSKFFTNNFNNIVKVFDKADKKIDKLTACEVHHIDGTDSVLKRSAEIAWLKDLNNNNSGCRILSNAKCLSEGVDVPALDAILFLNPRKSDVDIVQSVGRVMRRADNKKFGYVILPVVVPSDIKPEEALNNNESYKAVWQVLQALRAHDDTFNSIVNSINLNGDTGGKIIIDVIGKPGADGKSGNNNTQININFPVEKLRDFIKVKIVEKCGDREYWDKWARDMALIAQAHSTRINSLLNSNKPEVIKIFDEYLSGLRKNINGAITQDEAVNMLSQQLITKPVFDLIFNNFSANNPVSKTLEKILSWLETQGLDSETEQLEKFYEDVKSKIAIVKTDSGRQKVIKDLYERFFQIAFKKTSERLGIVYTPNEVVDFILRSADWAVKHELNIPEGLSARGVNILDPFTGTGTFIVRLLQLGILNPEILEHKYNHELHANEILLLAYYIAAVNIESAYHEALNNNNNFAPFPGIVLTDTFNLYKARQGVFDFTFQDNNGRIELQRNTDIQVIIGNPPYSVGQASANDDNQNLKYEELDNAITQTYAAQSKAKLVRSLYDSYIRAIKWASDRIKNKGVICYVTNGAFLDSNSADGLRKCLYQEFQSIYIFNLRGDAYTQGELRRKESGNVFGSGSRLPVAITLLIKNPDKANKPCKIYYKDIGDYLTREDKLRHIEAAVSFEFMMRRLEMTQIIPNEHGDWISKRSGIFETFYKLGNKDDKSGHKEPAIFDERYSKGVMTARDAWCYNFSREDLKHNMAAMLDVYNRERERWNNRSDKQADIQKFMTQDKKQISWCRSLYNSAAHDKELNFYEDAVRVSMYRPFTKNYMYFDRYLDNTIYLMPLIFPTPDSENRLICIPGIGSKKKFSTLMIDTLPSYDLIDKGQCFPLYWYEPDQSEASVQGNIFNNKLPEIKYNKRYAISDTALSRFKANYNDNNITHENIFYYIYGILSSPEYAARFGADVRMMLARVPFAKSAQDFWRFEQAGRKLAELHINYESAKQWHDLNLMNTPLSPGTIKDMHAVEKMRIKDLNGEKVIIYNENITIANIPAEAWHYVVNGKSALEWIVERYQNSVDKDSGLRNDANAWGREHDNPRYILDLIEKIITVSVETVKILDSLPEIGVEAEE